MTTLPDHDRGAAEAISWLLAIPHNQDEADVVRAWNARPPSAEGDELVAWLRERLAGDYARQKAQEAEDEGQRRAEVDAVFGVSGPRQIVMADRIDRMGQWHGGGAPATVRPLPE